LGHGVRKGRLVNTVLASFNTPTGEMTEMPQRQRKRPGSINYFWGDGLGSSSTFCERFNWL